MSTVSTTLPGKLQDWLEQQVNSGRYADASDYLRDLVRRDAEQAAAMLAEVQLLIDEGLNSGVTDLTLRDIRRGVLKDLGIPDANDAA